MSKADKSIRTPDIQSKIAARLLDDQHYDVVFRFPGEKDEEGNASLFAHKFVLATMSDVFEKMFFGALAEKNKDEEGRTIVKIEDIKIAVFKLLLRSIYGYEIIIPDYQFGIEFVYALDKYNCLDMISIVDKIMIEFVYTKTAIKLYECAAMVNLNLLKKKCCEIFSSHTDEILFSDEFFLAAPDTVVQIYQLEKLKIGSENHLVNALQSYIKHKMENDPEIEKKVRDAVYAIRFLTLDKFDITHTTLLSHEERKAFLAEIGSSKKACFIGEFSLNRENRCLLRSPKQQKTSKCLNIIKKMLISNGYGKCEACFLSYYDDDFCTCQSFVASVTAKSQFLINLYSKYKHARIDEYDENDLAELLDTVEDIEEFS
uniref:CSON000723 protein n=1 Tax=Culicoides sonorensis TaxID=179676 RepID=A0A336MFM2_CULSO